MLEQMSIYKFVHRFVEKNKTLEYIDVFAETFLPNPDGLEIVNHRDGNKRNNQLSNL